MDNRPVGVFDSGVGGLSAVRAMRRLLPEEDIVYFGDTGRTPYGTKGRDTIVRFTRQDIRFLLRFDVKAIVIACGTVSSSAFGEAAALAPVPVVGVIAPGARAAAAATKTKRVGSLGTNATIRSGSFAQALEKALPGVVAVPRACPLFVSLAENGYFERENPVLQLVAHDYLDGLRGQVDTLILGCTHYPLLSDAIADVMGPGVTLINTGAEVARETKRLLERENLLAQPGRKGNVRYFVSDRTDGFHRLAELLTGDAIGNVGLVEIDSL